MFNDHLQQPAQIAGLDAHAVNHFGRSTRTQQIDLHLTRAGDVDVRGLGGIRRHDTYTLCNPPLAPFVRAAEAFAGVVTDPATRASARIIQARGPKMPDTSAGT